MKKLKLSTEFIGFLQTVGLVSYLTLFVSFMFNANKLFNLPQTPLAPVIFFSLFIFSAIICASVMLGYPFYVFWEKKDFKTAAKIVANSVVWLFIFILTSCIFLAIKH